MLPTQQVKTKEQFEEGDQIRNAIYPYPPEILLDLLLLQQFMF